ncbi:hypothetical protein HYT32_01105 [Candidatus Roizmanbacteria bacterium]|nr:hypothetical protein [Candidatus Roizmanbacteria bacterium]
MLQSLASHYGFIMRVSLAFVFIWFGISELMNPVYFRGYIPPFSSNLLLYRDLLIQVHGGILVFLSICLIFKLFIKVIGLVSVFVIGFIVIGLLLNPEMGFNEVLVRDIGLLGLALAIWMNEMREK